MTEGVAGVGRVIVAASLIMSTVFFAFLLNPDRVSKEFALLLGIAILTDALLMRLTLVPGAADAARRAVVVDAGLAGQDPAQPHHRAARPSA